ncbi:hypothetical protein NC661_13325 [Aquibacillus koreensis]|uniref:Uncharacterized protein n=1 Tax=Aquibacillus koreensis TaxID=279446 RepID=A0A9X3WPS7_9BACI|nr:hypothetical protein [Aquibacillus koreensis]MCT2536298.1 hypothetical protein [Aquibacillus koreensis]MDC3421351.1 hypothetical protein [Aquibacillus koreensis]
MNEQELLHEVQLMTEILNQLHQDVNEMKEEVEDFQISELVTQVNELIMKMEDNFSRINNEIDLQRNELIQLKEQINTKDQDHSVNPATSEFRRMQSILQTSQNIETKKAPSTNVINRNTGKKFKSKKHK